MKIHKYIIGVCFLFTATPILSQVIINNKDHNTSGGVFHIDSNGDNDLAPTDSQIENDVFVDTEGRLGLGTLTPGMQLHIETNTTSNIPIRIVDGSQGNGRVFTSDAIGNGLWQNFGAIPVKNIAMGAAKTFTMTDVSGKYQYSNTPITLPPGLWLIEVNVLVYRAGGSGSTDFTPKAWIKTIISDTNTGQGPTTDSYGPGASGRMACDFVYAKNNGFNMINGYFIVNNKSGRNKTYYYMFGNVSIYGTIPSNATFSFGGNNESTIFATYIDEPKP